MIFFIPRPKRCLGLPSHVGIKDNDVLQSTQNLYHGSVGVSNSTNMYCQLGKTIGMVDIASSL